MAQHEEKRAKGHCWVTHIFVTVPHTHTSFPKLPSVLFSLKSHHFLFLMEIIFSSLWRKPLLTATNYGSAFTRTTLCTGSVKLNAKCPSIWFSVHLFLTASQVYLGQPRNGGQILIFTDRLGTIIASLDYCNKFGREIILEKCLKVAKRANFIYSF